MLGMTSKDRLFFATVFAVVLIALAAPVPPLLDQPTGYDTGLVRRSTLGSSLGSSASRSSDHRHRMSISGHSNPGPSMFNNGHGPGLSTHADDGASTHGQYSSDNSNHGWSSDTSSGPGPWHQSQQNYHAQQAHTDSSSSIPSWAFRTPETYPSSNEHSSHSSYYSPATYPSSNKHSSHSSYYSPATHPSSNEHSSHSSYYSPATHPSSNEHSSHSSHYSPQAYTDSSSSIPSWAFQTPETYRSSNEHSSDSFYHSPAHSSTDALDGHVPYHASHSTDSLEVQHGHNDGGHSYAQGGPYGQGSYPYRQGVHPQYGQGGYPPSGQGGYPPYGHGGYGHQRRSFAEEPSLNAMKQLD